MLDAFIIEQLRRRERQEKEREMERPVLRVPRDDERKKSPSKKREDKDKPERGVVVIDL